MDAKLRQLQLSELEILDEFVRVCEKNGLRYYLTGGTLLGAVRHQGFIPWDDDIDVAMPRFDYDRFTELAPAELDGKYFFQSPETEYRCRRALNALLPPGTERRASVRKLFIRRS